MQLKNAFDRFQRNLIESDPRLERSLVFVELVPLGAAKQILSNVSNLFSHQFPLPYDFIMTRKATCTFFNIIVKLK